MTREMKYSGVEWIGDIPSDWKIIKSKYIFANHKEIVGDREKEFERLSLTLNGVLKRPKDDSTGLQSDSLSTYQILYQNELVFKMIDLENTSTSRVGYSPYTGLVSPVYIIFNNEEYSRYGYWYFYNLWQRNIYNTLGNNGVRSALNASDMLRLPFIKTPQDEQKKIADFLDGKVTEIDKIIAETKSSIENYKEYKQAVITEAVTKGLDKNVQMKDSGVEWIGEIPVGWKVVKIKYIGTARNGLTYSPIEMCDSENGTIVLRSSNIKNDKLSFEDNVYVSKTIPTDLMVRKNDILICSRNGSKHLIGKNAVIENEILASFGAFMMIFRTNYNAKYVKYILDSDVFKYYLGTFLTATINQLTNDNFSNMKVVFCQDEKRQKTIVDYLDTKCTEIDNIISEKEKLISNLGEYKKSLIYEYVTGKKEVE